MNRLLISFAVVAAVACNDLIQGPEGGRKVYEANQQASPAIWKQKQELTIKTNDSEVISRIVIQDRRPQKDGEAKIISGGQGKQNVTIELSSPTVFRGYDFHVEVYAAEDNGQQLAYPEESMYNDTDVNYGANKGDESTNINKPIEAARDTNVEDKVQAPVATGKDTAPTMGQDKVVALVNADRKVRKTEQDSDSLQVKGMSADKVTTDKTNAPVDPNMTTEKAITPNAPLNLANAESSDGTSRPRMTAEEEFIQLYGKDAFNHFRGDSESSEETSTTEATVVDTGIPKGQPKVFSDISKELGQKVVFGIKRV